MSRALMLVALLCAGCHERHIDQVVIMPVVQPVAIYKDDETGCEYVAADMAHSALTPRMGADGKQICRNEPKP